MKVILIDDEPLALKGLSQQLQRLDTIEIEVIAMFTDAGEAIQHTASLQPDVIFIDIDMPELNGLDAAELLQEQLCSVHIVFVTASNEHAVMAFELNAVDYLLKPVKMERLKKTVDLLNKLLPSKTPVANEKSTGMVHSFQSLYIEVDKPIQVPWRTKQSQELFAYLLHHRCKPVNKQSLIELLWPDVPQEKAILNLYGTIYHIRKTLSQLELPIQINYSKSSYALQLSGFTSDVEEWERMLQAAPPLSTQSVPYHLRCFELNTGDYLSEHDYLWAEAERERLRTLWVNSALQLAEFFVQSERLKEALHIYHCILSRTPANEAAQMQTMKLYARMNNWSGVEKQYADYCHLLLEEYDIEASDELQAWYKQLWVHK